MTPTNYSGVTILNIYVSTITTLSSIRNIEAILLNEAAATELLQPTMDHEVPFFKSLEGVDEPETSESQ